MKSSDAVVVGGGVVGCITARELAKRGMETIVLEEHDKPGNFGKWTGILSTRGLGAIGVDYSKSVVTRVNGAVVHSQNHSFTVRRKNVAVVLDRKEFDEECMNEAVDAGADYRANSGAIGFSNGVKTKNSFFPAEFIIGADGSQSITAKSHGFPLIREFALCCEKEFSKASLNDGTLAEVFLDTGLFPGFFGWIVPAGDGARIGFGSTDFVAAKRAEKKFFESKAVRQAVGNASEVHGYWSVIPLKARAQTQKGNVMLVGDAAGQVKATTGGGVIFGGLCGTKAAEAVANGLDYEKKWRNAFGKTLSLHRFIHSTVFKLPNRLLDFSVGAGKFLALPRLLESFGDMDFVLTKK